MLNRFSTRFPLIPLILEDLRPQPALIPAFLSQSFVNVLEIASSTTRRCLPSHLFLLCASEGFEMVDACSVLMSQYH